MIDLIADSSVVAKWVLPEADSAAALRMLANSTKQGGRVVILDLAIIEVANAIWRRVHRKLIDVTHGDQLLDQLTRIPVHIEPAAQLIKPAFAIAAKYDRSVYDALFVAACDSLLLPGITADEPLIRAVGPTFPSIHLLSELP